MTQHPKRGCRCGFCPGNRVELHPSTDWWMRGARYGEVVGCGRTKNTVRVKLDKTGKTIRLHVRNVRVID